MGSQVSGLCSVFQHQWFETFPFLTFEIKSTLNKPFCNRGFFFLLCNEGWGCKIKDVTVMWPSQDGYLTVTSEDLDQGWIRQAQWAKVLRIFVIRLDGWRLCFVLYPPGSSGLRSRKWQQLPARQPLQAAGWAGWRHGISLSVQTQLAVGDVQITLYCFLVAFAETL